MFETKRLIAVMPVYRRACRFSGLHHLILLLNLHTPYVSWPFQFLGLFSSSGSLSSQIVNFNSQQILLGETYSKNVNLTMRITNIFITVCFVTWLYILLLCSGDVHPNPGPTPSASNDNFSSSSSNTSNILLDTLNQNHHLAFIHYNIQSLLPKIDILQAELYTFDIIALTETWSHPGIDTDEVTFQLCSPPERKDRHTDRHGGVILYVKEGINYRRRRELVNRKYWMPFGSKSPTETNAFYLEYFIDCPIADSEYFSLIETSINLAIGTGTPRHHSNWATSILICLQITQHVRYNRFVQNLLYTSQ